MQVRAIFILAQKCDFFSWKMDTIGLSTESQTPIFQRKTNFLDKTTFLMDNQYKFQLRIIIIQTYDY